LLEVLYIKIASPKRYRVSPTREIKRSHLHIVIALLLVFTNSSTATEQKPKRRLITAKQQQDLSNRMTVYHRLIRLEGRSEPKNRRESLIAAFRTGPTKIMQLFNESQPELFELFRSDLEKIQAPLLEAHAAKRYHHIEYIPPKMLIQSIDNKEGIQTGRKLGDYATDAEIETHIEQMQGLVDKVLLKESISPAELLALHVGHTVIETILTPRPVDMNLLDIPEIGGFFRPSDFTYNALKNDFPFFLRYPYKGNPNESIPKSFFRKVAHLQIALEEVPARELREDSIWWLTPIHFTGHDNAHGLNSWKQIFIFISGNNFWKPNFATDFAWRFKFFERVRTLKQHFEKIDDWVENTANGEEVFVLEEILFELLHEFGIPLEKTGKILDRYLSNMLGHTSLPPLESPNVDKIINQNLDLVFRSAQKKYPKIYGAQSTFYRTLKKIRPMLP